MFVAAFILALQTRTADVAGSYRLYASAMAGGNVVVNVPAGTLTMRTDSTYTAAGRTGRFALNGASARFLTGPYAGGSATFARRGSRLRVNVTTSFPGHPGRKLKLFGNRS